MKLLRLALRPFAGFREKEVIFEPGLNVVLGPNDAGKSTVFRAIETALFLPSKISKSTKEGREVLPRVLPIGGDHARANLEFEAKGKRHVLEKSWGQGNSCALESAGSPRLIAEEKVEEALLDLLPAPPATFQSVLLMGQGALEGTVATLEKSREALHSLGDCLRAQLDQGSGVSVDRLKALLTEKISAAFSHWDVLSQQPEKGRGIDDEWKKDVGTVLAAYYARERLKREASTALEVETLRDRRLGELNRKQSSLAEARAFVKTHEPLVTAVSERQALDARIAKPAADAETMVKDLNSWMQAESERRMFAPECDRLLAGQKRLEEELKLAMAAGKHKELTARLERAKTAEAALREALVRAAATPAFTQENLRELRAAFLEVDRLKSGLKAGKLQLSFHVKEELEVSVRKDLEAERKGRMVPGKPMTINAGGRIQLTSDLFELQVSSGEVSTTELEAAFGRASDQLGKLQALHAVASLDAAQERFDRFQEAAQGAKQAEALLKSVLLPGEKFEELEKAAAVAPTLLCRDPELVQAELSSLLRELSGKREGLVRCESVLQDLVRRHSVSSSEQLMARMIERKAELSELERKRNELPAPPPEVGNLEEFLVKFRGYQSSLSQLSDETRTLSVEIAELKARLPEQSAQDLERAFRDSAAAFQRELSRARALLRVKEAVASVEGVSGDVFGGFREEFSARVERLSTGKYPSAQLASGAVPTEFHRQDGALVPYGWLSAGTKDAFALALRLSMAAYFLGKDTGFLLLDDPLVNLDPRRQEIAAEMLREFAGTKQIVVFTCHPHHAELLGGHRIELS